VPVLLDRYSQAPPTTQAVIWAAMDARRLGAGPYLPLAWLAAAAHAHPADLTALGDAAWARGLYRDAVQLDKHATSHSAQAASKLVIRLHTLHPADRRPARHAAAHAPLDDPAGVASLLERLRRVGEKLATTLAKGLPAAGLFDQFVRIGDLDIRERFRFGREPDGSAAAPWGWDDLE
jgi:hypothetical protein